jgi:hypothetical protein
VMAKVLNLAEVAHDDVADFVLALAVDVLMIRTPGHC